MPVDVNSLKTLTGFTGEATSLQFFATEGEGVVSELSAQFAELSDSVKGRIELYLAAHFYVLSSEFGGRSFLQTGESSERYRTPSSDKVGYQSTRFGQQACTFDTTGTLIALSMPTSSDMDMETYSHERYEP